MKDFWRIVVLMMLMFALSGCNTMEQKGDTVDTAQRKEDIAKVEYVQITQDEAKALMDSEEGYIIVDVRTQEEYAQGHITGAVCIPNETIDSAEPELLTDKEQLILVYCRSGNRSKQAAQKLAEMGYSNVKEFGGINTWKYDVE